MLDLHPLSMIQTAATITHHGATQSETLANFRLVLKVVKQLAEDITSHKVQDGKNPHNEKGIICLECGKPFKMLRRHLNTDHGLTVDEYRHRHGILKSQPLVCPSYSKVRSKMAKEIGLGVRA